LSESKSLKALELVGLSNTKGLELTSPSLYQSGTLYDS